MSTAYAEETEVLDFSAAPESKLVAEYRNKSAVRWGWSPAMDIFVGDRKVLPPQKQLIKKGEVIPFRNRENKILAGDDKAGAPQAVSVNAVDVGEADDKSYVVEERTAFDCAEELRHAYGNTNPWGFTIFDALTGIEKREVVAGIVRVVLPKLLPLPEMIDYLEMESSLNIGKTEWPEGVLSTVNGIPMNCRQVADSVREQMLEGSRQAIEFCAEVRESSAEEMAQKASGGIGKARADKRDQMVSAALNQPVPVARPQAQPAAPVAPVINPSIEAALEILLKREAAREESGDRVAELAAKLEAQAEEARLLTTSVRELLAAKTEEPGAKSKGK